MGSENVSQIETFNFSSNFFRKEGDGLFDHNLVMNLGFIHKFLVKTASI